jgi:hypothetical protein
MAKDALGHGSDPQGLGNGPDPRGLRSGIKIMGGAQFSGKKLSGYSPSSGGAALVNNIRGGRPVNTHPSMTNSSGHAWGSLAALADFKREHDGPRDHAAEQRGFNSGAREIARLRRQGK